MLVTSQLPNQTTKFSIIFERALVPPTFKKVPPPMGTASVSGHVTRMIHKKTIAEV